MIFFNMIRHLLPNARAWRVTIDKKLRQFFEGLAGTGEDVKTFIDDIWLDIFPATTRELDAWDTQFGLRDTGLTEQQRRDRLDATWKALGGQDPRYIQDTLQANGFNVFVHEWWEPGTEPAPGVKQCVTPRSPLLVLRREFTLTSPRVDCGEPLAQCGEAFAEAGNGPDPQGYPLVNKVFTTVPDELVLCGEAVAECGEVDALCGNFFTFTERLRTYVVPLDQSKWPYFLYIGGETFGDMAQVDPKRRDEFEDLCLKICPTQQWLGILVEYT
jgi:hypothetical protein